MESSETQVLKILYTGGNYKFIDSLKSKPELFSLVLSDNSFSCINYLKNNSDVDAIICELNLPGMNAIELFKMLRSQNIHPNKPFLIFSEESSPSFKQEAFKIRISDFYENKVDPEGIYQRITGLIHYLEYFSIDRSVEQVHREYKIPWDKRLFDILVSSLALLGLSPVFIITAIAIRLESKGKVYYTSKRVGTSYRIFDFYKFRSMRIGADSALQNLKHLNQYEIDSEKSDEIEEFCPRCAVLENGETCSSVLFTEGRKICEYWYAETKKRKGSSTFIKIKDDPRVTKVGRFIRNTSIDEIPQLINVLKGDMSIVGNRPLPLYEAELLTSDDWSERFMGPAGITGLWQVEKRGKKGAMSEEERKALDNQYARTYSFWGDIKLILRTIPALFQKENV
ncbi:MAG: sugar transferase [Bacteroidales bacterium]|nr:sugar transferase [Bacteroidales bacterium]